MLFLSFWYILSPSLFKTRGVRVISIYTDAECGELEVGNLITELNGMYISNEQEFNSALKSAMIGNRVTMLINGRPDGCIVLNDSSLGIEISNPVSKGLKFGTDVVGGKGFLLSSREKVTERDISEVSEIIENRLTVEGFESYSTHAEGTTISISVPDGSSVNNLLEHGKIEGIIEQEIKFSDNIGKVKIGTESYDIVLNDSIIKINGTSFGVKEKFDLDGIELRILNTTNNSIILDALIFDNKDIKESTTSASLVKYDSASKQYQFSVPIEVSSEAGKRFSKVTEGLIPLYQFGSNSLSGLLVYYLDGEEISRLSIPSDLSGEPIGSISIVGGELSFNSATDKKTRVEIALKGVLEEDIFIESVKTFSGEYNWVLLFTIFVVCGTIVALYVSGFVLYKNLKIPTMGSLMLVLEIILIFGLAAASQSILQSGWIMDWFSLIGVCAFSIIRFFQIILLSERHLKRRVLKRYRKVISVVYISSFVLLFTSLRGFGLSLSTGFVATFLTTPIYLEFISRSK